MRLRRVDGVVLLIAVSAVAIAWTRHHGHAPLFPRFRREVREPLHSAVAVATKLDARGGNLIVTPPTMPRRAAAPSVAAYRSAIESGADHPGAQSFRADTDLYCEYNREEVEAQARK